MITPIPGAPLSRRSGHHRATPTPPRTRPSLSVVGVSSGSLTAMRCYRARAPKGRLQCQELSRLEAAEQRVERPSMVLICCLSLLSEVKCPQLAAMAAAGTATRENRIACVLRLVRRWRLLARRALSVVANDCCSSGWRRDWHGRRRGAVRPRRFEELMIVAVFVLPRYARALGVWAAEAPYFGGG